MLFLEDLNLKASRPRVSPRNKRMENGNSQQHKQENGFFKSHFFEPSQLADAIVNLIRQENSTLLPKCIKMELLTYILTQDDGLGNTTLAGSLKSSTRIQTMAEEFSKDDYLLPSENTKEGTSSYLL